MLSNIQIEEQVRCGRIKITPFDPGRLGANHYRLSLHSIQFVKLDEEGLLQQGKVIPNDAPYALNAHEYVVVSVREKIVLDHGLFGEFYPASMCIEEGIQLNCGRLGSFYEDRIHFGIFNMRDFDVFLREGQEIARVSFVDLGSEAPIQYQKRNDDYKLGPDAHHRLAFRLAGRWLTVCVAVPLGECAGYHSPTDPDKPARLSLQSLTISDRPPREVH